MAVLFLYIPMIRCLSLVRQSAPLDRREGAGSSPADGTLQRQRSRYTKLANTRREPGQQTQKKKRAEMPGDKKRKAECGKDKKMAEQDTRKGAGAENEMGVNPEPETGAGTENQGAGETAEATSPESLEIARLRAELARQKAATDKATKEAGDVRKQLRAKQTAEEIAAEEKRVSDEAKDAELRELRKMFAVAETGKRIMAFVGDEGAATEIAGYLYGAEDVEAAVSRLETAWKAREKALRAEFGKVSPPSAGAQEGPTVNREQLSAMDYRERALFARAHPEDYARLMGRK